MKSFKQFLSEKLDESSGAKPSLKMQVQNMNFVFDEPIHEPGYNPDLDRGEKSDSGIAAMEKRDGSFTGTVLVPFSQLAVLEAEKQSMNVKDYLESLIGDDLEPADLKPLFDVNNAEFVGRFLPSMPDMDYPDSLYESLLESMVTAISDNQYEVTNV